MSEVSLNIYGIDNAILSFNRMLNENPDTIKINEAKNRLQSTLNKFFYEVLPFRYSFLQKIPLPLSFAKMQIKTYLVSNCLCIEFPNLVNKKLNKNLATFNHYMEHSWSGRVTTIYDGEAGTVTYMIKMIAYEG